MGEGKNNHVLNWTNRFLSLLESKGSKAVVKRIEQNQKLLKEWGKSREREVP